MTTHQACKVDVAADARMKGEEGPPQQQILEQLREMDTIVACDYDHDVKSTQDVQSSERTVNTSRSTAWKSLKQQILHVMYGNETTASQLEKRKKRLSNYALKALCFALLILSAYLVQQYTLALFTIGESLWLLIALVLFLVIDAAILIPLLPNWGNALVCTSWFFLELALCILIISCNGYYGFAILVVLLLIVVVHVALLQPKLQHVLSHYNGDTTAQNEEKVDGNTSAQNQRDVDDQHLDHLFELSQVIANSGSLVTSIFGHYMIMAGPVNPVGFLFFCSIALALCMMMVITVRAVSRPHATCLAIVLMALIFITAITASIQVVFHGLGSTPQAVKSFNHRKMLTML